MEGYILLYYIILFLFLDGPGEDRNIWIMMKMGYCLEYLVYIVNITQVFSNTFIPILNVEPER